MNDCDQKLIIRKTEIWIYDYTSTFSASPSPSHTFTAELTTMKTSSEASTLTTADGKFDITFP